MLLISICQSFPVRFLLFSFRDFNKMVLWILYTGQLFAKTKSGKVIVVLKQNRKYSGQIGSSGSARGYDKLFFSHQYMTWAPIKNYVRKII